MKNCNICSNNGNRLPPTSHPHRPDSLTTSFSSLLHGSPFIILSAFNSLRTGCRRHIHVESLRTIALILIMCMRIFLEMSISFVKGFSLFCVLKCKDQLRSTNSETEIKRRHSRLALATPDTD